jgi:hypothetical protein
MEYENAEGDTSNREIEFKQANGDSFKAFCHHRNAIRTFRFDRILSITSLNHEYINAYNWASFHQGHEIIDYSDIEDDDITVVFTGVNKPIRDTYADKLDSLGYIVETKPDYETTYLVCGERANPKIIRKAERFGAEVLSLEQFDGLMKTGEIVRSEVAIPEEEDISHQPIKKDSFLLTSFGWVMGSSLMIYATLLFEYSIIGGIVGLLAGVVCLPPLVRSIRKDAKTEKQRAETTQGGYIWLGLFIFVVAGGLTYFLADDIDAEKEKILAEEKATENNPTKVVAPKAIAKKPADAYAETALTKQDSSVATMTLEEVLKPWNPQVSNIEVNGDVILVPLNQRRINYDIHYAIIEHGICAAISLGNKSLLEEVKEIHFLNEYGVQGFIFETPNQSCIELAIIENSKEHKLHMAFKTRVH